MATALLRTLDLEKFKDIFSHSPKQVREMIFDRLAIKKKATSLSKFSRPGEKNEERIKDLHVALQSAEDDEVADELLRNYFLKRRPLLSDALDAIGVKHDNGLTDSELDAFEKLSAGDAKALHDKLAAKHDAGDVALYLKFMKVPLKG